MRPVQTHQSVQHFGSKDRRHSSSSDEGEGFRNGYGLFEADVRQQMQRIDRGYSCLASGCIAKPVSTERRADAVRTVDTSSLHVVRPS